jgi:Tol biopolymer transport system component
MTQKASGAPDVASNAAAPTGETPLESWKEIAAYLQRDVRTAKRWEKSEGLPVRRHLHQARSSVYAYVSELDGWRAGRRPAAEPVPLWRRPLPTVSFALVLLLLVVTVGSGPYIGTTAQAADGIVTRQVWLEAHGVFEGAPSPDGKLMSYIDWESGNLAVRDLKAETSRILTSEGTWKEPAQFAGGSIWSPDGKQLAYLWQTESEFQLRVLAVDDPTPRVLFRGPGPLDWSPDGQQVLARISRTELALIPVKGGAPRVLKTFELGAPGARFSPDGRYIVYSRTPGKVAMADVFILDVSSGSEIPLIQHPADDHLFGWSPDGNWVLFLSDRSGTLDFWAIRVADGKPRGAPVRVKRSVGRVTPLGFTQDGSFYYADVKVARDVYAARVDFQTGKVLAPAEKAIVQFEGSNMNPRYSPDGKSLAYVSRRGSMVFPTNRANALCIQSLESGSERIFMDAFARLGVRTVAGPRWSPDSRSIVVAGLGVVGGQSGL